jgi:hypothetical protein
VSLSLRVVPLAAPAALPPVDRPPVPDRAVVWHPRLLPGGALDYGVLVEVVAGTVVREVVVAEDPERFGGYVATHVARTGPGCPKGIDLLDLRGAGKRLVGLGYRSGWAVVVADPGPDLAALAATWTAPRVVAPKGNGRSGQRPDFSIVLQGSCRPGSKPGAKFAAEPRVGLASLGNAVLATWIPGLNPVTGRDGRQLLRPKVGPIVGVLTAASALGATDLRDLVAACRQYGVEAPERTSDALDDLRAEARALAALYDAVRVEAQALRLPFDLGRLASPGGVASILLSATGLPPLADRFDLPERLRGAGAAAYHGGMFAARVVHRPVPAVLADLSAAYARSAAALGVSAYLVARRLVPTDVTGELRRLLASPNLAGRALDRATWRRLGVTLVAVRPRGEHWPTKAGDDLDVRPLDLGGDRAWFSWPDVIGAALRSGRVPEIVEAVHLRPVGRIRGLRPAPLPSGAQLDLGAGGDVFEELVTERARIAGDPSLDPTTRARRLGLVKSLANALVGDLARVDHVRAPRRTRDRAIAHDGRPVEARGRALERPGPWHNFTTAGTVTAACRLLLGATIAEVERLGGSWLHAAADSLTLAATHGAEAEEVAPGVVGLPLATLRAVLARTDALLRPDGGPSWTEEVGWNEPAVFLAHATNRAGYVLATGEVHHATETALGGRRVDPTNEGQGPDGHWRWSQALHAAYLRRVIGGGEPGTLPDDLPAWTDLPALIPGRATSPRVLERLRTACPGREVRPYTAYAVARGLGGHAVSLDATPATWRAAEWRSPEGKPVQLVSIENYAAAAVHGDPSTLVVPESIRATFRGWIGVGEPEVREVPLLRARMADAVPIGKESTYLLAPPASLDPLADDREELRARYPRRPCAGAGDDVDHPPARPRSAYCSAACRAAARRERRREPVPIRRCAGCGAELEGGRPQRRWCSVACHSRARRAAR